MQKYIGGNKKGQVPGNLEKERKRVRREVKMDKCPKQNQGYKDAHLSGKNGQVSDSRIRGIYYPPEKKEKEKKERKDSPRFPKAKIKEEERQQYEEQ